MRRRGTTGLRRGGHGVRRRGLLVVLLLATIAPAGCAREVSDRQLVADYFGASNAAAREGPAAQQRFFDRTQHPDFRTTRCPLDGATVTARPTMSTLRPDRDWVPAGADAAPRGTVYVVAVTATVRRDGVETGTQIGSQHVVTLDGRGYGFAPCLAGP